MLAVEISLNTRGIEARFNVDLRYSLCPCRSMHAFCLLSAVSRLLLHVGRLQFKTYVQFAVNNKKSGLGKQTRDKEELKKDRPVLCSVLFGFIQ